MTIRTALLVVLLGLPAAALLAFGPRGQRHVPPDRTVIRYWEKWTGVEAQAMQRIVDRFNQTVGAERRIWVDYNAVSNVDRRTLIATAGGDPPDLAGLFDYIVPQFADQGALMPLDELVEDFGIDLDAFKPVWLQIGRYRGRLYALPSTPYTIALYYNRRLYREAGLDPDQPPRTIAELEEHAQRLTRRDADGKIVQMGFTTSPAMLGWWHWIWPYFFDARLWDGRRFHLDTPTGRAAYHWIGDRRAQLGMADALAFEATAGAIEGAQNPFLSERLAMVFQGPWVSNWIRAYTPSLDYGVAPFPSVTAERQNVFASTDVFVIPSGSRHPAEALEFVAFVLRQDVMEELCSAHCKVSPFREPAPDFFANHPNPHIRVFDDMARSPHAFGYPQMPTFAEASNEMLFLLENVLRGVGDPNEVVRLTQRKIDSIVSEYQRMAAARRQARRDGG
jgi:ABC-type glycerol-3-phosphate transport system substrate-binding protein